MHQNPLQPERCRPPSNNLSIFDVAFIRSPWDAVLLCNKWQCVVCFSDFIAWFS